MSEWFEGLAGWVKTVGGAVLVLAALWGPAMDIYHRIQAVPEIEADVREVRREVGDVAGELCRLQQSEALRRCARAGVENVEDCREFMPDCSVVGGREEGPR